MKAAQTSIDRWIVKENVVYTYHGILFSFKKEGTLDKRYNMHETWGYDVEWSKPFTKGQTLHESTYMMRSLEESNPQRQKAEGWLLGPRVEWGMASQCFTDTEFQFGEMKKSCCLPNSANGLPASELHWKMAKMLNFMWCIFCPNKKKLTLLSPKEFPAFSVWSLQI